MKCESFFNFFEDIVPGETDKDSKPKEDDEGSDFGNETMDKLQDCLDQADQFKDDLVPLALEYYLGVIDIDEGPDDEDGDHSGSDGDGAGKKNKKGGDDSDED